MPSCEGSSLGFSRTIVGAQISRKTEYSTERRKTLSLLDAIPRNFNRKREERTLLGTPIDVSKFSYVAVKISESRFRNIKPDSLSTFERPDPREDPIVRFTRLIYDLGSINS
jgi:hypothetical protein